MTRRYEYLGNVYSFATYPHDNEIITVTYNESSKTVKVIDDNEYVFKVLKRSVKAKGGASGLYKFLDDSFFNQFMECFAANCIKGIIENTKAV